MSASAISAWAIKGPGGMIVDIQLEDSEIDAMTEFSAMQMEFGSDLGMQDYIGLGYTCVPVEIRSHPAQDAALLKSNAASDLADKIEAAQDSDANYLLSIIGTDMDIVIAALRTLACHAAAHLTNTEPK